MYTTTIIMLCILHVCRVVQEVDEVIGTKSCVTGFELKQLTYTTQVHSYCYYYAMHAYMARLASTTKTKPIYN